MLPARISGRRTSMWTVMQRSTRRVLLATTMAFVPTSRAFSIEAVPGLASYTTALVEHPLQTNVATAMALAFAGDAVAQRRTGAPYDTKRAASFVVFDACYRGGFQTPALPWIIEHCHGDLLGSAADVLAISADPGVLAALERTAFNQFLIVPFLYYPLFFGVTGAVQGLDLDQSMARAKGQFVDLQAKNWAFWLPAQFYQFTFLPIEAQVPYTCVMGLVWNVILSAIAGSARPALEQEPGTTGVIVPTDKAGVGRKDPSEGTVARVRSESGRR